MEKLQQDCYNEWMSLQAKRMTELKQALSNGEKDDAELRKLISTVVGEFKNYAAKRCKHSRRFSSNYFAPTWNTCLENALLWMGGCRPSSFIRLVYAMCGSQTELRLTNFLRNNNIDGERIYFVEIEWLHTSKLYISFFFFFFLPKVFLVLDSLNVFVFFFFFLFKLYNYDSKANFLLKFIFNNHLGPP